MTIFADYGEEKQQLDYHSMHLLNQIIKPCLNIQVIQDVL